MIYKGFQGLRLSALGLGCMRLPVVDGKDDQIDQEQVEEMVAYARARGINYFDTAWGYHGGNSEIAIGKALSAYPRDSFYLATKFPGFAPENMARVREIFEKQLEKCQVDYFDFYLFHNVSERNVEGYLDPQYGIFDYLMEQKKAGRIRHLGFSTHGSRATIRRFLEAYGKDLDFVQIQLNYLDWTLQNAKAKVELIRAYGLPVWVMEPVRGGRLAKLPEEDMAALNALRPGATAPEWAFRFLQSVEGVGMILSGMSNMDQLRENIATFQTEKPLNARERAALDAIAREMIQVNKVPCTGCSYCTARCPQGLPIPQIFKSRNENTPAPEGVGPQDCLACHSCEIVCPQGISIAELMARYAGKG